MTDQPSTNWEIEDRKRTQECVDAAAEVAQEPTPRVWPISGPNARGLNIGREWAGKEWIPDVEVKE